MVRRVQASKIRGGADVMTIVLLIAILILSVYTVFLLTETESPFGSDTTAKLSVGGFTDGDGNQGIQIRVMEYPKDGQLYYQVNNGAVNRLQTETNAVSTLYRGQDFPENATISVYERQPSGIDEEIIRFETSSFIGNSSQ